MCLSVSVCVCFIEENKSRPSTENSHSEQHFKLEQIKLGTHIIQTTKIYIRTANYFFHSLHRFIDGIHN